MSYAGMSDSGASREILDRSPQLSRLIQVAWVAALSVLITHDSVGYETTHLEVCTTAVRTSPSHAPLRERQFALETRFISRSDVAAAYRAPPRKFLTREGEEVTVGIVDPTRAEIALRISNVLTRSIDMARAERGGHIPGIVVDRLQATIASPEGVQKNWSNQGYRFLLTRQVPSDDSQVEVLGTIVVTRDHDTIFFLSGRHNNLRPERDATGRIQRYLDDAGFSIDQKYVDSDIASFMSPLSRYKPDGFYQIANFAFLPEVRGSGMAKKTLSTIMEMIVSHAPDNQGKTLFPKAGGTGFWQIGEPPWQGRMRPMNFRADPTEHVYMLPDRALQVPVVQTGKMTNVEFNESWEVLEEYHVAIEILLKRETTDPRLPAALLQRYRKIMTTPEMRKVRSRLDSDPKTRARITANVEAAGLKFPERLPALYDLALNAEAKLQYKMLVASFEDVRRSL